MIIPFGHLLHALHSLKDGVENCKWRDDLAEEAERIRRSQVIYEQETERQRKRAAVDRSRLSALLSGLPDGERERAVVALASNDRELIHQALLRSLAFVLTDNDRTVDRGYNGYGW